MIGIRTVQFVDPEREDPPFVGELWVKYSGHPNQARLLLWVKYREPVRVAVRPSGSARLWLVGDPKQ